MLLELQKERRKNRIDNDLNKYWPNINHICPKTVTSQNQESLWPQQDKYTVFIYQGTPTKLNASGWNYWKQKVCEEKQSGRGENKRMSNCPPPPRPSVSDSWLVLSNGGDWKTASASVLETLNLEFSVKENSFKTEDEEMKHLEINPGQENHEPTCTIGIATEVPQAAGESESLGAGEEQSSGWKGCPLSGPYLLLRFNVLRCSVVRTAQPCGFCLCFQIVPSPLIDSEINLSGHEQ